MDKHHIIKQNSVTVSHNEFKKIPEIVHKTHAKYIYALTQTKIYYESICLKTKTA